MTDHFLVYRVPFEDVVSRLDARFDRRNVGDGTVISFFYEVSIPIRVTGNSIRYRSRLTISVTKEIPYTKIRVQLSEWKLLGVLALAVILASLIFIAAFSLWYMPFVLVFSTAVYYVLFRYHSRKVMDGLISDLKSVLNE